MFPIATLLQISLLVEFISGHVLDRDLKRPDLKFAVDNIVSWMLSCRGLGSSTSIILSMIYPINPSISS
jgi:hypothetical protein